MIHEKMADKLGLGTGEARVPGRQHRDGPLRRGPQAGVDAASAAPSALGFTVVGKRSRTTGPVDARDGDSNPVEWKVEAQ
jgi:hypothetical protein